MAIDLDAFLANVTEVKKVRLEPGDALIVKIDYTLSRAQSTDIRKNLAALFKEGGITPPPIIVIDGGVDVQVGVVSQSVFDAVDQAPDDPQPVAEWHPEMWRG